MISDLFGLVVMCLGNTRVCSVVVFCKLDSASARAENIGSVTRRSLYAQTLRIFGHWLNSIAVHAPEGPLLFAGTHKDELKDKPAALGQAQKILTEFLNDIPLPDILMRIQRPSDGKWFFAVDNKSREITAGGKEQTSDLSVGEIRSTLERVVNNDKREVRGVFLDFSYAMLSNMCID